jgi:hypothetical protein
MNPAVAEWVSKAEGDFVTAGREMRARKSPNYDAVCFHSQQWYLLNISEMMHTVPTLAPRASVGTFPRFIEMIPTMRGKIS